MQKTSLLPEHSLPPGNMPQWIMSHKEDLAHQGLVMDTSCVVSRAPVKNSVILRKPEGKKCANDSFQITVLPGRVGGFMPMVKPAVLVEEVIATNTPEWNDVYDPFLGQNVLIIDDSFFVCSAVVKENVFESKAKLDMIMKDYFQLAILPRRSENACSLRFFKDGQLVEMRRFIVNVSNQGRTSKRWNVPEHVWLQVCEAGKKRQEPQFHGVLAYS